MQRETVADDRDRAAGALDVGYAQGQGVLAVGHLAAHQAVGFLVLEKDHRVVVADGGLEQALGVVGSAGSDHLQARSVEEVSLHVLGVEQPSADSAAVGDAHGHGDLHRAVGAVAGAGGFADELVDRRPDEVGELYLRHGTLAAEGRAEGDADDRRFGEGGVYDAVFAELFHQPLGCQEHPAAGAHVFTHDEDGGVSLHFFADGLAYGFDYALVCH